jgi:DDE superfamily endonuclease
MWCVPKLDEEYVARMEDVLTLYSAPSKRAYPLVCLDERPVQLHDEVRAPTCVKPGRPARHDSEYKRKGTANVFAIVAPRLGLHLTHATKNRKSPSYVRALQRIAKAFPKAKRIHLVQDNLSSHTEAACIRTLGPIEGRKLWARFIVHFTPKHGSWLNIAETEISMWSRECLGKRRLAKLKVLRSETCAWNKRVNRDSRRILWKFNVEDARRKFKLRVVNSSTED